MNTYTTTNRMNGSRTNMSSANNPLVPQTTAPIREIEERLALEL